MVTTLQISPLQQQDKEVYRQALVRSYHEYEENFSKIDWPKYIASVAASVDNTEYELCFVAKDGDKVVGGLQIFIGAEKAYHHNTLNIDGPIIRYLFVDPIAQGKGIAKQLLQFTHEQLKNKGYENVHLHSGKMMTKSMAFYERFGYKREEAKDFEIDHYPIYCYKYELK